MGASACVGGRLCLGLSYVRPLPCDYTGMCGLVRQGQGE